MSKNEELVAENSDLNARLEDCSGKIVLLNNNCKSKDSEIERLKRLSSELNDKVLSKGRHLEVEWKNKRELNSKLNDDKIELESLKKQLEELGNKNSTLNEEMSNLESRLKNSSENNLILKKQMTTIKEQREELLKAKDQDSRLVGELKQKLLSLESDFDAKRNLNFLVESVSKNCKSRLRA